MAFLRSSCAEASCFFLASITCSAAHHQTSAGSHRRHYQASMYAGIQTQAVQLQKTYQRFHLVKPCSQPPAVQQRPP